MKKSLLSLLLLPALLASAAADDVAVMEIQFGKEKPLQTVVMDLYEQDAPQTVDNFKKLARKGFYKGIQIHRAFPGVLVQTGDPMSRGKNREAVGTGGPGYTLPAEIKRKTSPGSLAMGRLPDKTNPARRSSGSQFFITLQSMPDYDGEYTVFGEVISGLDVVEAMSRKATDSNDYPVTPIRIRSLRVMPREKAGLAAAQ